jgi:hypothetical protein
VALRQYLRAAKRRSELDCGHFLRPARIENRLNNCLCVIKSSDLAAQLLNRQERIIMKISYIAGHSQYLSLACVAPTFAADHTMSGHMMHKMMSHEIMNTKMMHGTT